MILSATYMLWMFQRVNYGPVDEREERAAARSAAARVGGASCRSSPLTMLMGVLPNLFLRPIEPSVERMLNQVRDGAQIEFRPHARPTAAISQPRRASR